MKVLSIGLFLILTNQVFGQKNLFETLKIDSATKIIGRYPQYDKSKTYERYNFIIEDSAEISQFIKRLKLGKEVENSSEDPSFKLTIVKNHDEIGSWTINPTLGSAMTHDGHTYKFDLSQIANLNKQFPFSYYHDIKVFKSKDEYETYLAEQKTIQSFFLTMDHNLNTKAVLKLSFQKLLDFPIQKQLVNF